MSTGRPPVVREPIIAVLKAAGANGVSCEELATMLKTTRHSVKNIVARLRNAHEPISTVSIGGNRRRYVLQSEVTAGALVCKRAQPRRGAAFVMLQRLKEAGAGGIKRDALVEGLTRPAANRAIVRLMESGDMHTRRMPGMAGAAMYFSRAEHLAAAVEIAMLTVRSRERRVVQKVPVVQPAAEPAKPVKAPAVQLRRPGSAWPPTKPKQVAAVSVIVPAGLKVQRGPACTDTRYTVDKPTPYFSALAVGSYAPGETWAARAYGGRA